MKKKISLKESFPVALTVLGMIFGVTNMIFPVQLGQWSGNNAIVAAAGFIIMAGVIPALAIAAFGRSESENLLGLSSHISGGYAVIFTTIAYLAFGLLYAIPGGAKLSFDVGVKPLLGDEHALIAQLIYSAVFFIFVAVFSWNPRKISLWVGKILTPVMLVLVLVIAVAAIINMSAGGEAVQASGFLMGIFEGYGTMNVVAGLAIGVIIIDIINDLGYEKDEEVSSAATGIGITAAVLLTVVFAVLVIAGKGTSEDVSLENVGQSLVQLASGGLGSAGGIVLAVTVVLAGLTTAIGLVTSSAQMFVRMFHRPFNYRGWVLLFSLLSFVVTNFGYYAIIVLSSTVLTLIGPLAAVLIILGIFDKAFGGSHAVYTWTSIGAFIGALADLLGYNLEISAVAGILSKIPLGDKGLAWLITAAVGLIIGLIVKLLKKSGNDH